MDDPPRSVPLSGQTYHALRFVAKIDQMPLEEIVETLVAAYFRDPAPRHSSG